MATLIDIKKNLEFHKDFFSLIDVLKGIAVSQFHALEKRLKRFEEFIEIIEGFSETLDGFAVDHPFVSPGDAPLGVIAVTSDAGLLGGLNQRVMTLARKYLQAGRNQLVVIGLQGQNALQGSGVPFQTFPGIMEDKEHLQAGALRDFIVKEVLAGRMGAVKIIYPYAPSVSVQRIAELDLLPYARKDSADPARRTEDRPQIVVTETVMESSGEDVLEYVVRVWMEQKLYDIFQMSRLAEYAARIVHLEESSQKIKEIQKKLQLQYFRARHEIIDQQMRELFTARSLFAESYG
jgi:ATP synthase F1 gamma subunit